MIVGIDANSKTIAASWWDGVEYDCRKFVVWDRWSIEAAQWFRKIMDRFMRKLNMGPDDYVFVEEPLVFGKGGRVAATIKQSYINGIIQASVGVAGATCVHVHPSTWKQTTQIPYRASKEDIARIIDAYLSDTSPAFAQRLSEANDQDLYDSAAITIHGRTVVEGLEV